MKNLSEDKIKLKVIGGGIKYRTIDPKNYDVDWELSDFKAVEVVNNSDHYRIHVRGGGIIPVEKGNCCEIRKVEKGFFAGCYVVLNKSFGFARESSAYLIGDKGAVRLPIEKGDIERQVDEMLEKTAFEKMVARQLNSINISIGKVQWYQLLCERLPRRCWQDKTFVKNILEEFDKIGQISIENDVDPKYINLEICKQEAGEFFVKFAKQQQKEIAGEKVK
ncbi:MAG: hypothetical protein J6J24_04535 [Clostridia bacterium]|nr:hypothetical protein [Clostridia bacterium]